MYDSGTDSDTQTASDVPADGQGLIIYSSCSNTANNNFFSLYGSTTVNFDVADENNNVGSDDAIHSDFYYLNDKYDKYFFTHNRYYCSIVYQIHAKNSYHMELYSNGEFVGQDSCIGWYKYYYKFPKKHSNSYTLISALPYNGYYANESIAKQCAPTLDRNNVWQVGYGDYLICSPLTNFNECPSIGYTGNNYDYIPSPSFTSTGVGYGISKHKDHNDIVRAYI